MSIATISQPFSEIPHPEVAQANVLAVLDDPHEWSAFSRPCADNADLWESSVVIEGMHCAACSVTVEDALRAMPGVISARVSAASQRATVRWAPEQVLPSQWMQAVQGSGYRAVPANDVFMAERRKLETRKALWRWLVAGLCMMQVMMYAYPAYIAHAGDLTPEMEQLLRWASWVLTLPVLLFSCGPFFSRAWQDVLARRVSMDLPVALGIGITFAVSTAGTFEPQGMFGAEVYFDSLTMFVFFLLSGRWLELRLRDRTAGALEVLMNRLPESAERQCADGSFERVAVRRIAVGDVLRLYPGEAIPVDGVVAFGRSEVDEALLTGESHPLQRTVGMAVLAGSHNLGATLGVKVTAVGKDTRFSEIVSLMESASASKPAVAVLADRLAKPFLLGVLACSALAAAWWWGRNPEHALMVAVAVLVVTCPCALSLATPAAMLAAAGRLARGGVLVRQLQALESLSKVDTVVFDKTGTLTRDALGVASISCREGFEPAQALALAAAMGFHSRHPASQALYRAWLQASGSGLPLPVCDAVSESAGEGLKGEVLLGGVMRSLRLGSALFCDVEPGAGEPTRGGPQVFLSNTHGWLASFHLVEDVRADAPATIQALKAMKIDVRLMSGDASPAVNTVASLLGLEAAQGDCSPADKLAGLRVLQAQGKTVAMVGDGLNDGPILAGAHVSFAFGQSLAITQARADFVVLGDKLMAIAQSVHLARRTMAVVRQNLWWALIYNSACVPLAVVGWLPAWLAGLGMAASSLGVVANAMRLSHNGADLDHPDI
jgi:Cu2+-exporting ATPase